MKTILFILTTITISAFMMISCTKEVIEKEKNYEDLLKSISLAGEQHNRGLDLFIKKVKNSPEKLTRLYKASERKISDLSSLEAVELVDELVFLQQDILGEQEEFKVLTERQISQILKYANTDLVNSILVNGSVPEEINLTGKLYYPNEEQYLSPKVKELLDILQEALSSQSNDYAAIISVFNQVENRAYSECNEEEKVIVLSATNIGKSSLEYWYYNSQEWENLIDGRSTTLNRQKKPSIWKTIGGADVAGGVAGAVRAAVINIWPGAGQAA